MASTPPTELPPQPSQPGTPETPPPEIAPTTPDIDVPAPMPTSDPAVSPGQPTDLGDFA